MHLLFNFEGLKQKIMFKYRHIYMSIHKHIDSKIHIYIYIYNTYRLFSFNSSIIGNIVVSFFPGLELILEPLACDDV